MSSVHCVVVWEWQCNGQWLPHTPGVTRTLERAHAKKLTRVVLADADPALRGHYVNLRTLTQCFDTPDGGTVECGVRRSCYSVQSPAGRGTSWEWTRLVSPPLGGELNYEPLPMEFQCLLEESWSVGVEVVMYDVWTVCVSRMTARHNNTNVVSLLRRVPHPPYPLTRTEHTATHHTQGRRPRIPQQHTGSSVHSVQSSRSLQSTQSCPGGHTAPRSGARSVSPRDRKPGFRQILHNLNIFSHNNKQPPAPVCNVTEEVGDSGEEHRTDTECGSTRSTRRHSVDTVSTYLSHESKESLQQAVVGELLNCSAGSDDVFETSPPPLSPINTTSDGSIVGVDEAMSSVCVWVRSVRCAQWGALCPSCMSPLTDTHAPVVALVECAHMIHLHCLNRQLDQLRAKQVALYIECLVCGRVYGGREGDSEASTGRECGGMQPPGSMSWAIQPQALPQHPHYTSSILITYNFQSGRQGPQHPVPGAPYYAVGFPRYTLLPDTVLGRQVLSALRVAWERGVLFSVSASQTTGREYVVSWCVQPPPSTTQHYITHTHAHTHTILRDALARIHALIDNSTTHHNRREGPLTR